MAGISRRGFVAAAGVALAGAATFALAGCGSSSSSSSSTSSSSTEASASLVSEGDYKLVKAGTITAACSADYPPMEYQEDDKIVGFDPAVMEEIASRLGLECEFLPTQSFDTLVTQVAAHTKMDVAISAITINDDRAEQVDFSDPYYDSNLAIVVLKDSGYTSRDDIEGLPLGAQSGSTGEAWAKENYPNNEYTPFDTTVECLAALRTGQVNAVVYDEPVASNQVSSDEYSDCEILDVVATGEQYGIIISKDNAALTEAINGALADMESDGTMDELKKKWIGEVDVVAGSQSSDGETKAASSKADKSAAADKSDESDKSDAADKSKD